MTSNIIYYIWYLITFIDTPTSESDEAEYTPFFKEPL